jgi:hypothetical protein
MGRRKGTGWQLYVPNTVVECTGGICSCFATEHVNPIKFFHKDGTCVVECRSIPSRKVGHGYEI